MSELVLSPTKALTEGTGSSHAPYIVATDVISGASATAWIDGSDASYGKCDAGRTSRGQYAKWFDVDPTIDPTWITAIGVRFRASCHTASAPFVVQLFAQTAKLLSNPFIGGDLPLTTSITPDAWTDYDYVIPAADYDTAGWAPAGLASAADPTATLYAWTVPTDGTGEFTSADVILIAEQSLVIYYTIPDGGGGDEAAILAHTPLRTRQSPLRQYPRNDGLGTSSAPRTWPPPPSVQASNRRAGGYL